MNLTTRVLVQYFQGLSIWGKVAVIAGYVPVLLLIMLWETSKAHRHDARRSSIAMPTSTIEETKKLIHTVTTSSSKENQYNPHKRTGHLLKMFRRNFSKSIIHRKSRADGNSPAYQLQEYIPQHILSILEKLRRRVNQSGKEP